MSTFTGFSEEDLKRMKLGEISSKSGQLMKTTYARKIDKFGVKTPQFKMPLQNSDESIDNIQFDKCRLSIKTPTPTSAADFVYDNSKLEKDMERDIEINSHENNDFNSPSGDVNGDTEVDNRKSSVSMNLDLIRGDNIYTEDELARHRAKLEELQLQQKLMEEQNKKRKEMLAKALADRTRQTEEEVLKLEKIKKELQVLDGQFSQDVTVIRRKIDQACLSYSEAEKHYLRIEKEFLQAKMNLQKEREKKELLTEHLCALITHNETRKAQKLETLMLQLASDKNKVNGQLSDGVINVNNAQKDDGNDDDDDKPRVIVDGVDERTGKMVELAKPN